MPSETIKSIAGIIRRSCEFHPRFMSKQYAIVNCEKDMRNLGLITVSNTARGDARHEQGARRPSGVRAMRRRSAIPLRTCRLVPTALGLARSLLRSHGRSVDAGAILCGST